MKEKRRDLTREHIVRHRNLVEELNTTEFSNTLLDISECCYESLMNGGKIIFMGNGGSAADAQHLAAELVGRYLQERKPLAAVALSVNSSILTAVANDYSYNDVFTRQLEAIGREGDVAVGITTSGSSRNVVDALSKAREMNIKTIAFTGENIDTLKEVSDIILSIPGDETPIIQEMHIMAGHIICGIIEKMVCAKEVEGQL